MQDFSSLTSEEEFKAMAALIRHIGVRHSA